MSISKKIRFEVFKRDGFKCAYCGRTPPEVILEVDHIQPKSNEGKNDLDNLVTACFNCNRGKSNIPLDKLPKKLELDLESEKEKELQLIEFNKLLARKEKRIIKEIEVVNNIFNQYYEEHILSDSFKQDTIRMFLNKLNVQSLIEAMHIACSKFTDKNIATKYFCGICWNKTKESDPKYQAKRELEKYWENQPFGIGYLANNCLEDWIEEYTVDEIKSAMKKARGYWRELLEILES